MDMKVLLTGSNGFIPGEELAGGSSFLSDLFTFNKKLSGGAPYNHRIRYTLTLDKIIGAEGTNHFHPITNHVGAPDTTGEQYANIKGGTAKNWTSFSQSTTHITTSNGGTPDLEFCWRRHILRKHSLSVAHLILGKNFLFSLKNRNLFQSLGLIGQH